MTRSLIDFLKKQDVEFIESFDISSVSAIGIGGVASVAVMPNDETQLINVIEFLYSNGIKFKIVGRMTNILQIEDIYNGVLILTGKMSGYSLAENIVAVKCGAVLSKILKEVSAENLGGAEELYGIPGSVGGMVYGNAGAYGKAVSDIFVSARFYCPSEKRIFHLTNSDMNFSYRSSLIKNTDYVLLSSELLFQNKQKEDVTKRIREITNLRQLSQPYGKKSLGSVFKRYSDVPISKLIDELGLKGLTVGGASVSKKHAGFIVNNGDARAGDVLRLIEIIKEKIYNAYGIVAEEEIEYM